MARVDIQGKIVEFPDDLSPDQLQSAVSSAAAQLGAIAQPQKKPDGFKIPAMIQKAAQMATTPIRGFRGMGVGMQQALSGVSPLSFLPGQSPSRADSSAMMQNAPFALERAAEAVKPGFEPQVGERTGAALGEAAGMAGLTAPLAPLAPGSMLARAAISGATSGGLSSLMDASEEGRFNPGKTAFNTAVGTALPLIGSKGFADKSAKVAGAIGRVQSGVDQRAGERLFKDPGAFFSPSEAAAGEKLGLIRTKSGLNPIERTVDEIVDAEASGARKLVRKTAKILESNEASSLRPIDLLKAKQATDDIIEVTPMKQRVKRANLFELKNKFTDALELVAPGDKAAAKEYSRSALASKFRRVLPVTKSGDISLTRTLFLPALEGGAALAGPKGLVAGGAAIAAQSPIISGAGISAAGSALQGTQAAVNNPVARQAVTSLVRTASTNIPKPTKEEAKEFKLMAKKMRPELEGDALNQFARQLWKEKKSKEK